MKSLLTIGSWPRSVFLASAALIAIGVAAIIMGSVDPEGMQVRELHHSVAIGIFFSVLGIGGLVGLRLFVWFVCLVWLAFVFLCLKMRATDSIGLAWTIVWTVLWLYPAFAVLRHEIRRKQETNSSPSIPRT